MDPEEHLFSDERLKKDLASLKEKDIKDSIYEIRADVKAFAKEAPQSDDITMLALKFNGKA